MADQNAKQYFVPLTKILATFLFSFMAIVLTNPYDIAVVAGVELLLLLLAGKFVNQFRNVLAFFIFAAVLGLIQYFFVPDIAAAVQTALRMFCMATIFLFLLVTTSLQDLTASLVEQCRIPYEYAFMFTAALRFIPDFIAESNAVREAQMCRGMDLSSSISKRLKSYRGLVQPLVLRNLARSETMALSLELRGFGSSKHIFSQTVKMNLQDYIAILLMLLGVAGSIYIQYLQFAK